MARLNLNILITFKANVLNRGICQNHAKKWTNGKEVALTNSQYNDKYIEFFKIFKRYTVYVRSFDCDNKQS